MASFCKKKMMKRWFSSDDYLKSGPDFQNVISCLYMNGGTEAADCPKDMMFYNHHPHQLMRETVTPNTNEDDHTKSSDDESTKPLDLRLHKESRTTNLTTDPANGHDPTSSGFVMNTKSDYSDVSSTATLLNIPRADETCGMFRDVEHGYHGINNMSYSANCKKMRRSSIFDSIDSSDVSINYDNHCLTEPSSYIYNDEHDYNNFCITNGNQSSYSVDCCSPSQTLKKHISDDINIQKCCTSKSVIFNTDAIQVALNVLPEVDIHGTMEKADQDKLLDMSNKQFNALIDGKSLEIQNMYKTNRRKALNRRTAKTSRLKRIERIEKQKEMVKAKEMLLRRSGEEIELFRLQLAEDKKKNDFQR